MQYVLLLTLQYCIITWFISDVLVGYRVLYYKLSGQITRLDVHGHQWPADACCFARAPVGL